MATTIHFGQVKMPYKDFKVSTRAIIYNKLEGHYDNITNQINLTKNGNLADFPVTIRVTRRLYQMPEQRNDFIIHILNSKELRQPKAIQFISSVLETVEAAYFPLYNSRILMRNVQVGLTNNFCSKMTITDDHIKNYYKGDFDPEIIHIDTQNKFKRALWSEGPDGGLLYQRTCFLFTHRIIDFYNLTKEQETHEFKANSWGQFSLFDD